MGCAVVIRCCAAFAHGGEADLSAHTGLPTPGDLELIKRHEQFQQEYQRQKLECVKTGKVALVTPMTPDGNQASFTCVSHDDPQYEAQHPTEPEPPPTKLAPLLETLVGQNVNVAVRWLGGPQGEPMIESDVVYTWSYSTRYTVPYTTLYDEDRTETCVIQLFTNPATKIVKRFAWAEERGGCQTSAESLKGPPTR